MWTTFIYTHIILWIGRKRLRQRETVQCEKKDDDLLSQLFYLIQHYSLIMTAESYWLRRPNLTLPALTF